MYYSTTKRAAKSVKIYVKFIFYIWSYYGIIECGIFGLYWYIKVTYGERKKIDDDNALYINALGIEYLDAQSVRYGSFVLSFFVSFIFYFPATGYLFYRSPLSFALSHLICAVLAVFVH